MDVKCIKICILLLSPKLTGFLFTIEIFIDLFDNQHIHLCTLHTTCLLQGNKFNVNCNTRLYTNMKFIASYSVIQEPDRTYAQHLIKATD